MKRLSVYSSIITMLATVGCAEDAANLDNVERLYSYYINSWETETAEIDTLRRYCTDDFVARWKGETEYDLILQAQDTYTEWASMLSVSADPANRKNVCLVCFPGDQGYCLLVMLKEENGKWKVDDVRPYDS
jgi:hypothetical protein